MKLETKSFPIIQEGSGHSKHAFIRKIQEWTPYAITPLQDHKVHVASIGTFSVENFSEKEITLTLRFEKPFLLKQDAVDTNQYDVAGLGVLRIYDNACTFTSKRGMVFTVPIPSMDKRDAICTGMAYHAIESRVVGGF